MLRVVIQLDRAVTFKKDLWLQCSQVNKSSSVEINSPNSTFNSLCIIGLHLFCSQRYLLLNFIVRTELKKKQKQKQTNKQTKIRAIKQKKQKNCNTSTELKWGGYHPL